MEAVSSSLFLVKFLDHSSFLLQLTKNKHIININHLILRECSQLVIGRHMTQFVNTGHVSVNEVSFDKKNP